MKKFHVFLLTFAVLVVMLVLPACAKETTPAPAPASAPAPAPAQTVTLKIGYDTPPTTSLGIPAEYFAKRLTERSGGRIKAETYPSGTLSTMASSLESLRAGVADAYVISLAGHANAFPLSNVTGMIGLNFYPDTVANQKAESDTLRGIIKDFPDVAKEYQGLKMLYNGVYGTTVLLSKSKLIRTPSDIVGVKVGCAGLKQEFFSLIGAVPVMTVPPGMYQGLQNGVIDSCISTWGAAGDWQLWEVTGNVLETSFGGAANPLIINLDAFNKLSAADQQLVMDIAAETEELARQANLESKTKGRDGFVKAGVNIVIPTAAENAQWEEKFALQWNKYVEQNQAAGKNAKGVLDYWKQAFSSRPDK